MPHKNMLINPPRIPPPGRREGKGKWRGANIHWNP